MIPDSARLLRIDRVSLPGAGAHNFKVPEAEQAELKAIVADTYGDIVIT